MQLISWLNSVLCSVQTPPTQRRQSMLTGIDCKLLNWQRLEERGRAKDEKTVESKIRWEEDWLKVEGEEKCQKAETRVLESNHSGQAEEPHRFINEDIWLQCMRKARPSPLRLIKVFFSGPVICTQTDPWAAKHEVGREIFLPHSDFFDWNLIVTNVS